MKRKQFVSLILFLFSGIFLLLGIFFFWRERADTSLPAAASMEKEAGTGGKGENQPESSRGSTDNVLTGDDLAADAGENIGKENIKTEDIGPEDIETEGSETKDNETENIESGNSGVRNSMQSTENDLEQNQEEDEAEIVSSGEIPVRELIEQPYKDYFLRNSDMVAWLKIPGTIIDYPVMWTLEDEEYYLYRGFDKKSNKNGCLILDTDSCLTPLTTNLIIHGHNNRGAMFGELDKYEKESYRDEHPYIYLYGRDYEHIYEVMAVFRSKVYYTTDVCFKYYKFFQADTEEEFEDFYGNVKAMAEYETGVEASFGDRFITLSTCAYHTENGRLVVVGKEIEPGEFYQSFDDTEQ